MIPFSIDLVDPDNDTITGTAAEGSQVFVQADGNWRYPIADATDTWVADFSQPGTQPGEENPVDIGPGSSGGATLIAAGGSATTVLWSISSAAFSADPDGEHVWGWEFAPNASVTITIDDTEHGPFGTDGGGSFDTYFDPAVVDIAEGSVIVVTDDDDTEKTHTVTALAITGADETLDRVSGTAAAGTDVHVWVNETGASQDVTATDGTWVADFAGEADLGPGSNGGAEQGDDDGDSTHIAWQISNPTVNVDPRNDGVWGDGWTPNGEVTISVNDVEHSTLLADDYGNFGEGWDLMGLDLVADDKVEATQGDVTKTHMVTSLAITGIDVDTEIMTGTADGPFDVWVHDTDAWRHLDHAGGGWSIDWSVPAYDEDGNGTADLEPGTNGNSTECDDDGDCTWADWRVANPSFSVRIDEGEVHGYTWPLGIDVTLEIDDLTNGEGVDYSATLSPEPAPWDPAQTWVQFRPGEDGFILEAGQIVTMGNGEVTKIHVVTPLVTTTVDVDADTVEGTTGPDTYLTVQIYDGGPSHEVMSDEVGNWLADYSPGAEQGEWDIVPGTQGEASEYDEDGDSTKQGWNVTNPVVNVDPRNDGVWGDGWTPNGEVTISVNDVGHSTLLADDWGNFGEGWDPMGLDLVAGDKVEATQGDVTKTHDVTNLAITAIDVDTEIMTGTADGPLDVWVHDTDAQRHVDHDGVGEWTVDWSIPGPNEGEEVTADLEPGSNGNSNECDDDGDCTWADWRVANPSFSVETPFYVWSHGEGWVEGRTVTVMVDDNDDPTDGILHNDSALVERWGPEPWEVGWSLELEDGFEIKPGHFVSVYDGVDIEKALLVEELEIVDIDEDADTIFGTATPFANVEVNAGTGDYHAYRSVEADENGDWFANFGVPGEDDWEQDIFDVQPGVGGAAQVFDEDGDSTHRGWQAVATSATVDGHVYLGEDPLPGVEVFMAPDEVFTCTDAAGYFTFEDVSPVGDGFVATGPAYSDAGCANTAFVDPDGMPLLVAAEGELDLTDGYEEVKLNVEYAAAIQYVRVEDITGRHADSSGRRGDSSVRSQRS